jgi:hypothetical protein
MVLTSCRFAQTGVHRRNRKEPVDQGVTPDDGYSGPIGINRHHKG